ncbi:MAG: ABC transporter substrate-binding protein, partial [Sulfurimonadaceae bacterium]|nr:ABC transporter substrate-binding protein [Sulfurimonadaceae bacterium]
MIRLVIAILCLSFLPIFAAQKPLEKVSLQLQWLDQFQFAGYYMAIEKGYYREAGLDVELIPFKQGV